MIMDNQPQPSTIAPALIELITAAVMGRDGEERGGEIRFRCPWPEHHANGDARPSCRFNREKATWYCDVGQVGGGALDLAKALDVPLPARRAVVAGSGVTLAAHSEAKRLPVELLAGL